MTDGRESRDGTGRKSKWEWVAAAVSTALVLAVVGYMAFDAVARPRTPPAIEVARGNVLQVRGGWLVEFRAFNHGHETAAGVKVEGTLEDGGRTVETSEATLDFVPGRATRRGGLFFREDPRARAMELRALGYQEP